MNAAIDRKIAEYLVSMDEADREEPKAASACVVETEREAKLMRTPHGHAVAYNAQTAVDAKHKLIVAFELTNEGNDYRQLYPMAAQGKDAVGADQVTAVADTGYSNGEHGALCEQDAAPRWRSHRRPTPTRSLPRWMRIGTVWTLRTARMKGWLLRALTGILDRCRPPYGPSTRPQRP
jgi:hypothetical protein